MYEYSHGKTSRVWFIAAGSVVSAENISRKPRKKRLLSSIVTFWSQLIFSVFFLNSVLEL